MLACVCVCIYISSLRACVCVFVLSCNCTPVAVYSCDASFYAAGACAVEYTRKLVCTSNAEAETWAAAAVPSSGFLYSALVFFFVSTLIVGGRNGLAREREGNGAIPTWLCGFGTEKLR